MPISSSLPDNSLIVEQIEKHRSTDLSTALFISDTTAMMKRDTTLFTKRIMPLGFQKPAEFYAPKYDQPNQNIKPDLRTTIHWQPNLTTNEEGKASFKFYTADTPSTYTVVIEGVTDDGKVVYKRDKVVVKP